MQRSLALILMPCRRKKLQPYSLSGHQQGIYGGCFIRNENCQDWQYGMTKIETLALGPHRPVSQIHVSHFFYCEARRSSLVLTDVGARKTGEIRERMPSRKRQESNVQCILTT